MGSMVLMTLYVKDGLVFHQVKPLRSGLFFRALSVAQQRKAFTVADVSSERATTAHECLMRMMVRGWLRCVRPAKRNGQQPALYELTELGRKLHAKDNGA